MYLVTNLLKGATRRKLAALAIAALAIVFLAAISFNERTESRVEGLPDGYFVGTTTSQNTEKRHRYYVFIPPQSKRSTDSLPLIVFLAGWGERFGSRVDFQVGLADAIRRRIRKGKEFSFVALFPINPFCSWKPGTSSALATIETIDWVVKQHRINPRRIYLTGHSDGGAGVWDLASAFPEKWAAVVPLATRNWPCIEVVRDIPCWIFHGAKDDVVPVAGVRALVKELADHGADVQYKELPDGKHIIWQEVYDDERLYLWLASKVKSE